jgi:xanthine/uracil permease
MEHKVEHNQEYRKKQAVLCLLVFLCIAAAFVAPNAMLATGAVMVGIVFALLGARIQPEPPPEEHH